ncbi:MAG TPA: hypothetical protein VL098_03145 [Flavipsychrobacter sp.]|nr:hypothetical protein [Flavipsychrobacter sp.]
MIFQRTYRYKTVMPIEEIRNKLVGKHIETHHLDFEISEKNGMLRIIPHAEMEAGVKTLPITHVDLKGNSSNTNLKISAKMRRIDSGGPYLIAIFCLFMVIAAAMFFMAGNAEYRMYGYILGGVGLGIFIIFWLKMETGYFDYVRKIRDYIKKETSAS